MIINFVGTFTTGYVGEQADQVHLARELEALGHTVRKIPQDEWREHVIDGKPYPNVPPKLKADINIITKWHHFYDQTFIQHLRKDSEAPVFYWVWDYMYDGGFPDWHIKMAKEADLYISNEDGIHDLYAVHGIANYYFPFDVADGEIPPYHYPESHKKYDVTFFGSCIGQGNRIEWLTEINKTNPIKIFAWNPEEWIKRGFDAEPAVYGVNLAEKVAQSKIILGFSVNPNCWGYWSNRVGKILTLGGFLLYQYAPGMELFLRDGAEYFSSIEEAREKIDHYLVAHSERDQIAKRGFEIGEDRFTSKARVKELSILMERFIKSNGKGWNF